MTLYGLLSPRRLARHTLVVACLALVMLGQSWWTALRAVGMATGTEVCTAQGARMVDDQGQPLPAKMSHLGHDCCWSGVADVLVARVASLPVMALHHGVPPDAHRPGWWDAEWRGPLSRGPPPIA